MSEERVRVPILTATPAEIERRRELVRDGMARLQLDVDAQVHGKVRVPVSITPPGEPERTPRNLFREAIDRINEARGRAYLAAADSPGHAAIRAGIARTRRSNPFGAFVFAITIDQPKQSGGLGGHAMAQGETACGLCGAPWGTWTRLEPCPGRARKAAP